MKLTAALVALCACWAASGCAPAMTRAPGDFHAHATPRRSHAGFNRRMSSERIASAHPEAAGRPKPNASRPEPAVQLAAHAEEIDAPPAVPSVESVVTADDISDPDALNRRVDEVRLDIRPPKGEMPTDLAAAAFSADAQAESTEDSWGRQETVVAWTPWTLCYRPLYLEDIPLERYGQTAGCLEPGVSAAKFFLGVGLLPYKAFAQPPRSCVCSNGFSRCGDPMPPGYKDYRVRLDASAFEAGVLAGIVLSLP